MTQNAKLDKNVILAGLTSFFTDVSSEMLYPLIQAFVTMVLAAQKALLGPVLGIIEGIAESTASLLKVFIGYYSDKFQNRKTPTIIGYALSAVSKGILFFASTGWPFVLFSRFFDRIGKGMRTAPRDAIITESTPEKIRGKAFGFHRAMDFAGAAVGVLICYAASLRLMDPVTKTLKDLNAFYFLFVLSIVPAFLGVLFLFPIREKRISVRQNRNRPQPNLHLGRYDRNLKLFFSAVFLFTLGNSSNQFLLLRSMSLGHTLPTVILMYMLFNVSTSLLSTFFGSLSDRIGRKRLIVLGHTLYAVVYMSFGWISKNTNSLLWVTWILYGVYYATSEGVEKALVSDLAPAHSRATALGFYHTIVGIGLLPASLIAGFLYSVHPGAPFVFGGTMSLASAGVIVCFLRSQ